MWDFGEYLLYWKCVFVWFLVRILSVCVWFLVRVFGCVFLCFWFDCYVLWFVEFVIIVVSDCFSDGESSVGVFFGCVVVVDGWDNEGDWEYYCGGYGVWRWECCGVLCCGCCDGILYCILWSYVGYVDDFGGRWWVELGSGSLCELSESV